MKKLFIFMLMLVLAMSIAYSANQGPKQVSALSAGNQNNSLDDEKGMDDAGQKGQAPNSSANAATNASNQPDMPKQQQEQKQVQDQEGEQAQIQIQQRNQSNAGNTQNMGFAQAAGIGQGLKKNQQVQVQVRNNQVPLKLGMDISEEKSQNRTQYKAKLSNGKNAEIKVMPKTASERALERLRIKACSNETGCQIELKEVGSGNQTRAAYEVQAQKEAKVLGLFRARMQVSAQVDAENGEVIRAKKPWWAFLASEG